MVSILIIMLVCCVIGYKVLGLIWGLKKITNKGKSKSERERASENRVARVLGLYFKSTTENNSVTVIVIY